MLRQGLNESFSDAHRASVTVECIELSTRALRLQGEEQSPDWANLMHARGVRHLDLARLGLSASLPGGVEDIREYQSWLRQSDAVPEHWRREVMVAQADVDVAEFHVLAGENHLAVALLETAIESMEAGGVPDWMTSRAYGLLDRAGF